MAVYKDINSSVRIGGSLTLPAGSITLGSTVTIDNASGQITATKFSGDGSALTNLSSSAMTDVLLLNGSRTMSGALVLGNQALKLRSSSDSNHTLQWQQNDAGGTLLDGPRLQGYAGVELTSTGGGAASQLAVFRTSGIALNYATTITANLSVAGYTITGSTINATSNLQENGTNLSSKYLLLAGGTLTGDLALQTAGTATSTNEYWSRVLRFYSSHWNGTTAVSNSGYIQLDNLGGYYFATNGSGSNTQVFTISNAGNVVAAGKVTATQYVVGSTPVIDTNGKVDWSYIKNTPSSWAATMITTDSTHRFVADTDISNWNAKATTAEVTQSADGLMIAADKAKLDGIATGATKITSSATNGNIQINGAETTVYTLPSTLPATMITTDSTHRFVADTDTTNWNGKANASTAISTSGTSGLTGGGDLTASRSLAISWGGTGTATTASRSDHNHDTTYLKLSGGTLTGLLTLSGDPTSSLHAATKQYIDRKAAFISENTLYAKSPMDLYPSGMVSVHKNNAQLSGEDWPTSAGLVVTYSSRDSADDNKSNTWYPGAVHQVYYAESSNTVYQRFAYASKAYNGISQWTASTAVALNTLWMPSSTHGNGYYYKCTTAGTTGTTEPTWPTSGTVTDGTAVWTIVSSFWNPWDKVLTNSTIAASDIPNLDWSKITTGKPTTLSNYGITDAINTSAATTTATAGKLLYLDSNSKLPTSITGNADGNAATATKLATARTITLTGDATASAISFDGSANISIATTLANSGVTAGTYQSVTVNAKGLITGGTNPTTVSGYGITDALTTAGGQTVSGTMTHSGAVTINNTLTVNGSSYADRLYQNWNGTPTSNLGTPSVAEMAFLDKQFTNKTWFYNPSLITFDYTMDGTTWTTQTVDAATIANFVSGRNNTTINIPNKAITFRITIQNDGNYVYLNALYMYWSSQSHSTQVKIQKSLADGNNTWTDHTSSTNTISAWPGHMYLPFSTIPFNKNNTVQYGAIRIVFTPTWSNDATYGTYPIQLNGMEIWGAYPSGFREIYSWDSNRNVTFPTSLTAASINVGSYGVWHAGNFDPTTKLATTTPYLGLDASGSSTYPRMYAVNNPGSDTTGWIRVSSNAGGILPYSNSNSYIGTSSWQFGSIYGATLYENGTALSSKYLGISAQAADSAMLNGQSASYYATATHTHTSIVSRGSVTAETGTARPAVNGLSMSEVYNNGYPTTYGNVLTLAGIGKGQILVGWNGGSVADGVTPGLVADTYIRSQRDSANTSWSPWAKIWTDQNFNPSNYVANGSTNQSTGSGFTVGGTLYLGTTTSGTNNGTLIVRNAGNASIQLDGNGAGNVNTGTVKAYVNGATGDATFSGKMTANSIAVTSNTMVSNLNAELFQGNRPYNFDVPVSNNDMFGFGVISGMQPHQGGATGPDATIKIDPGVVYTSSGRRFQFTTSFTATVPAAYSSYNRNDLYYVRGPVNGSGAADPANEGTIQYAQGATDGSIPTVPTGSVILAKVYVPMNPQGGVTVADGSTGETPTLFDNRVWMPFRYDGVNTWKMTGYLQVANDITEGGSFLRNKYAQLATANTFTGNQTINGATVMNYSSTIGGNSPTSGTLQISGGGTTLALDANEIYCTSDLWIEAPNNVINIGAGASNSGNNIKVHNTGHLQAPKNAATVTIPAGQTSVTWTHNYGATTYAVTLGSNSFDRHVRWNPTSKLANSIVIEIDASTTQDILVDCILMGY